MLSKARRLLDEAAKTFDAEAYNAAGRAAYLAGLNAARALIYESTGRSLKTHKGVHTEFYRLARHDERIPSELRSFLDVSYNLKMAADYEVEPESDVSPDVAKKSVEAAARFVDKMAEIIEVGV